MNTDAQYRVIVVEDDPATRRLLERQLRDVGYDVEAYPDGREALDPITSMRTGIVLADWGMPQMDGLQLCAAVRELELMQAIGRVYFILLTAHNGKEQVVRGLDAGANDYLTKPYHPGELLARIGVGVRMLRLQQELLEKTLEFQKANTRLALLTRRLEELANTDTLTGLSNRRSLFERFYDTWELAKRDHHALSCIMMDVDRFKSINDTYGHDAGDRVLRSIAEVLRQGARRPDLCGRIGGEEFVVVCPATAAEGASIMAERIRQQVGALQVEHKDQMLQVTVSCGVAQMSGDVATPEELLKHADAMLYHAKRAGRNQTWVYDAPNARPATPLSAVALAEPPTI